MPLRLDGPIGTSLVGLPPGVWSASWNLTRPDAVREAHRRWAGAEVVHANTFGASPEVFPHEYEALALAGVKLARETGAVVAGSIAPGGSPEAARAAAAALLGAGADLIHLETQLSPESALASARAIRRLFPRTPLWVSFAILRHQAWEPLFQALLDAGVQGVGFNCAVDAERMATTVASIHKDFPLLLRPEGGRPYPLGEPQGMLGVGACCGSTPAQLHALWDHAKCG